MIITLIIYPGSKTMNKAMKLVSNSLLLVFFLGLMVLPMVSITLMGVSSKSNNVLSDQDKRLKTPEEMAKETTQSNQVTPRTF